MNAPRMAHGVGVFVLDGSGMISLLKLKS